MRERLKDAQMGNVQFGNDPGKADRYRAFWERVESRRPLVGFTLRGWLPLEEYQAARAWPVDAILKPEMVAPDAFLNDEERLLSEGEIFDDDIFRGDMPAAAVIPWLSGMLGSRLRILPGNVLGEDRSAAWIELENLHLDRENAWFKKYVEFLRALIRHSGGRYPVSHGSFIGPLDMLAELRGHTQAMIDLMEEPERAAEVLWRGARIYEELMWESRNQLQPFHGGYFDGMYQLWAPGPIMRIQNDSSSLLSPSLYRQFLLPVERHLAQSCPYSFVHLHSTSMFLLPDILELEEIGCFEINNDVFGPPLADMLPHFQAVQAAQRSLLIRGSLTVEEARLLVDSLDPRGLYLLVLVKDLGEAERLRPPLGM